MSGLPSPSMNMIPATAPYGIENNALEQQQQQQDDQDSSEAGTKKRKASSVALANDNELRKLLRQHEGYTLKQMAGEVIKSEGSGGKSEKAKQVFAMLW